MSKKSKKKNSKKKGKSSKLITIGIDDVELKKELDRCFIDILTNIGKRLKDD